MVDGYITYFCVAPGWQRVLLSLTQCGIGKVMLYYLIQYSGRIDITLHVSANNPAMILYQYFGFKPEEFIVGFYERYLPEESRECKNAFLVRLKR